MKQRHSLRQQLRQQRRSLSSRLRRHYNRAISRHLANHPLFLRSRHLAVYLPNDGEPSLDALIRRAWRMGKQVYLPVLQPFKPRLWFLPYTAHSLLRPNRFGIPEPRQGTRRTPRSLDLVLAPLVGFDRHGNRLGMGGGFYDRTFALWRPKLLGVAYSFQEVPHLDCAPWDIPLWGIATECGVLRCQGTQP